MKWYFYKKVAVLFVITKNLRKLDVPQKLSDDLVLQRNTL